MEQVVCKAFYKLCFSNTRWSCKNKGYRLSFIRNSGAVSLDDLKNWRRSQTGAMTEAMARAESVIESELEGLHL